ncbi:hypothetical protein [Pseudomonas coronafaciens]|uniref:Uncharacterized protein n=1 Tax=Pseudomonas coronafaciens pv. coronafaciens TaxID=235275 RepID=A0AAE6QGP7_9PSED|nr:hypothetical protein [Pseudomonas coronafaciens]QGT82215.1 hypothetical protein GMO17_14030 [Pseudomonas coronafaciens pv. coronafaciens]
MGFKLLKLFREAESLPGGYWIPTPFRIIEIGESLVFVGILPTALGFLTQRPSEGLCRILTPEAAKEFPREDLRSWMGGVSGNPKSEVVDFSESHRVRARPINHQDDIEYLSFNRMATVSAANSGQSAWSRRPVTVVDNEIALCRQWKFGFYRYFSSDIRSGRNISEAVINQPVSRLLYALAHQAGSPIAFSVRYGTESVALRATEKLPAEEYRLALLLSRHVERQGRYTTFFVAYQFAPVLIESFKDLGCVMEIDQ